MGFSPSILAAVAIGGSLGAVLRYTLSVWSVSRFGDSFPWGTLLANMIGALFIGALAAQINNKVSHDLWRPFLMVGLLGGLTTFSTFSLELLSFVQRGDVLLGFGYLLVSVVLGVGLTYMGYVLVSG